MEPVQVILVRWDALQDLEVVEIPFEMEHQMEGLTHGIDEIMVDQLPL